MFDIGEQKMDESARKCINEIVDDASEEEKSKKIDLLQKLFAQHHFGSDIHLDCLNQTEEKKPEDK